MNENVRGQFVKVLFNGLTYWNILKKAEEERNILLLVYSKISFNNLVMVSMEVESCCTS